MLLFAGTAEGTIAEILGVPESALQEIRGCDLSQYLVDLLLTQEEEVSGCWSIPVVV